jgi:hypothetical protein
LFLTVSLMTDEPVGALPEFKKMVVPDVTFMHEV